MKNFIALSLLALVSANAYGFAAVELKCKSANGQKSAVYDTSMFGDTLTVSEQVGGREVKTTYFPDATSDDVKKIMLQDDPKKEGAQQLKGTYGAQIVENGEIDSLEFRFLGDKYTCLDRYGNAPAPARTVDIGDGIDVNVGEVPSSN